jgi:arylformamidase
LQLRADGFEFKLNLKPMIKTSFCLLFGAASLTVASAQTNKPANPLPPATFSNVKYGPHERNVLDFWQATSNTQAPLLIYIHGGGWRGGDKSTLSPDILKFMLGHGISVAAINYRYSDQARLPAPVHDAARAVQFLRSKAADWRINKQRVAAMGGSAGACTTLWLAYHDDLANPKSDDPIARESTRLSAGVGISGQTSIDPEVIVPWVGEQIMNHLMIARAVGAKDRQEVKERYAEFQQLYHEFSPINHVTKDDPPVLLYYRQPTPLPAPDPGTAIHHAMLGQKLKEKADAVGAPCELQYDEKGKEAKIVSEFLLKHLITP